MRQVTEELQRVEREIATPTGAVVGTDQLDPAQRGVLTPGRVVDPRMAEGKPGRLRG